MTRDGIWRAGIIGTGAIAEYHARAIEAQPGARLVGVVDRSREGAEQFAARWGDPAVHDTLERLLDAESLDVLHVCTPPGVHAEQTVAALEAGVHVIVEKPPALALDQLDIMQRAADRAGKALAVVFQQRTGTGAAHVRALLESGALGRPLVATCHTLWYRDADYFAVPWRGRWESEGGGPTLGHGIHQLDLLAWLLGDWESVRGQLWRVDRETQTEDVSSAVVTFANGVVASVFTSAVSPRQTSSIRIDTERATITVDHLYGHRHENWRITRAPHVSDAEAAEWSLPVDEEPSGHDPLIRDVYAALRSGTELPSTASDPARSLEIVTAIYASATSGETVTPQTLRQASAHRASLESPVVDRRPTRD